MKSSKTITVLVLCIAVLSLLATATGIFSDHGPGMYEFTSIRGQTVQIYGKGIYQHMSAEVAPQGIAQDVVTLFVGIPLLLLSLWWSVKGARRGKVLLAGTLGYFLVTYLFYMVMGMYNALFLAYIILTATSFFALIMMMRSLHTENVSTYFTEKLPVKLIGGFLIFNAIAIGLLWLSMIVPPLIDGTVIPLQVEHYTTLIVQGLDLSLLLPIAFLSGVLLIKRKPLGYLLAPVYMIFLSILMTALTAKVIAIALTGASVFPVVIIIPVFNIIAVFCTVLTLRNIKPQATVASVASARQDTPSYDYLDGAGKKHNPVSVKKRFVP